MSIDEVNLDDPIPCPQCGGRGEVPHGHGRTWATCPTCEGRSVTVRDVLAKGWPADVLAETYPTVLGKAAHALLIEEED